jgi:hypothetical protein
MQYCARKSAMQSPGYESWPALLAREGNDRLVLGFIDLNTWAHDSLLAEPAAGYLAGDLSGRVG